MNIELNQQAAPGGPAPSPSSRPARRPLAFDAGLARAAAGGLWAASCAGAGVSALGVPTGLGTGADVAIAIVLNAAVLALSGLLLAWLFRLLRLPQRLPPLTIGAAIYSLALLTFALAFGEIAWPFALPIAAVYLAGGAGAGLLAAILLGRRHSLRRKGAALLAAAALAGGAGYAVVGPPPSGGTGGLAPAAQPASAAPIATALPDDPSQPGAYAYRTFTYGSGTDRQRAAFGAQAELQSAPADASAYIAKWPWLRKLFWGFDQRSLPLNGRVWLPEGEGPFPVVLMVHGNHMMEDFSDEGYAYLGELLASRGFAAISVDENFLNYSAWSGIPKQDMKVRAWLLLKHIGQLQQFAADPSTPFYGRLDFDNVALIGHSRGGQAVAMAADPGEWFAADAADLPAPDSYAVRAVIAIAPTDTVVDGRQAQLRDVSYLTLQGASDADVSTFDGARQYERTSFSSSDSQAFKASLYIGGANHGQFNTTWGARDEAMPTGLFLRKPELSGEEQRQIAKTYVAAMLETTLHGQPNDEPLFRDYRTGAAFLPQTAYFSRFEDGSFQPVARYADGAAEADRSRPAPGVTAEASGLTQWDTQEQVDRSSHGKGNDGVRLQWPAGGGAYTLRAEGAFPQGASLIFSMADLNETGVSPLQLTIEAEDADGHTASVPLNEIMPIQPPDRTRFLWLNGLARVMADGKYEREAQAAFQTYEVPLDDFPGLDSNKLTRVTFAFQGGAGEAMLDDIGFEQSQKSS